MIKKLNLTLWVKNGIITRVFNEIICVKNNKERNVNNGRKKRKATKDYKS